jgi:Phospholipase_D-nuclease N-terminal
MGAWCELSLRPTSGQATDQQLDASGDIPERWPNRSELTPELTRTGWSFSEDERVKFDPRDTNGIVSEEDTMVLADVGLWQLIWTTLFIFMLVMFLWVFIVVVRDLFRDRELSGWARAGWLVALIFFPLLGSLVYLIARGGWTAEDSAARAQLTRTEFDSYGRSVADSTGDRAGGRPDPAGRAAEQRHDH